MDFERIAVIGPGLLGGSLARAASRRREKSALDAVPVEVRVWGRREEPLARLRDAGDATLASTSMEEVASGADLVILATPIGVMADCLRRMIAAGAIGAGVVVTDVGSVKGSVVAELEPLVSAAGGSFVGSHPMAGSERTGLEHASADLFEGAACLITPTAMSDAADLDRVEIFWKWLGASTFRLSPEAHDSAVARVSHLPHLLAVMLVETVLGRSPELGDFAGGGFRDTTRIAGGAPEMWAEILMENRRAVEEVLRQFQAITGESLAFFEDGKKEDLRRLLTKAKSRRDHLPS